MKYNKVICKEDFSKLRNTFRENNQKIILCHGVYDLLHYGHIEHLIEAKKQGEILVVSVTSARYVKKGPNRPYFNDKQRMEFLSNIGIVDYVILSEAVTVHDIVKHVQPDVYVKGQEYEQARNDITGNIEDEIEVVKQYGGSVYFTRGNVFSSTKILNNFFDLLPKDIMQFSHQMRNKYGDDIEKIVQEYMASFKNLKVLVVGDIIIDEYIFCSIQGVTSKDVVLSTRYEGEERYAGGALAVARHLANFSDHVSLCSMMGPENNLKKFIENTMKKVTLLLEHEHNFVTPVKKRFLKRNPQRQEYDKLFSINLMLSNSEMKEFNRSKFNTKLRNEIDSFDLVVVCDYGHGLIDDETMKILEEKSKFLAVNCQTNSSNYGMNLITKYQRADCLVVDERELRLAFGQALSECKQLLNLLDEKVSARYSWVTMGSKGATGNREGEQSEVPAVTLHVKDTVGAGDAFYSIAALCAQRNVPLDIATLLCNIAGAIKTNVVGNERPIEKVEVLKFFSTILNV